MKTIYQDAYTSSIQTGDAGTYKLDHGVIHQVKSELETRKLRFLNTVQNSITHQISFGQGAWKELPAEDVQSAAQEAVSENGYWGVKQTSERIIGFAQGLVGSDPSHAEEMRAAFIKGYQAAVEAWGGTLPEISQKTYDAVMKLFDEWAGVPSEDGKNVPAPDSGGEEACQGGSVQFHAEKRTRQLTSARTIEDMRALMSLLAADLSDCKAGLEKGWCDEAEVAKVEAMIQKAQDRMPQFSVSASGAKQNGAPPSVLDVTSAAESTATSV